MNQFLAQARVMLTGAVSIFLGGAGQGYAQEQAPQDVHVRVLCYKRVQPGTRVGIFNPDGKVLSGSGSLELPLYQLSEPIQLTGRSFNFIPTDAKDAPKWAPQNPMRATVALPGTGKEFILFFVPSGPDETGPYKVIPIPAPEDEFKGGAYLLINGSKEILGGHFGKGAFKLNPGASTIVPPSSPDNDPASRMAVLHTWDATTSAWSLRPFLSFPLASNVRQRELLVFFSSPTTGKVLFRAVQDPLPGE